MEEINLLDLTRDIRVLYVEDDDMLRQKTTVLFKEFFFDVHDATDGSTGLNMYKENLLDSPYDLVISDINMPKMNGIELSQNILRINPEQSIIIISAYNDSDFLVDLMELGITHFIQKPIKLIQLKEKLRVVCQEILKRKKEKILQKEYQDFYELQEKQSKENTEKFLSEILEEAENLDIP